RLGERCREVICVLVRRVELNLEHRNGSVLLKIVGFPRFTPACLGVTGTFFAVDNLSLVKEDHFLIEYFLFDYCMHAITVAVDEQNLASFIPVANGPGAFVEHCGPLPVGVVIPEDVPYFRCGGLDFDVKFKLFHVEWFLSLNIQTYGQFFWTAVYRCVNFRGVLRHIFNRRAAAVGDTLCALCEKPMCAMWFKRLLNHIAHIGAHTNT